MSRRPAAPTVGRIDTARARMAPGGRMWSESPIRSPRRRVAVAGVPSTSTAEPPNYFHAYDAHVNNTNSISGGAFPDGLTHALVLVGGMNCNGFTPPAGWTELDGGGPHGAGDVSGGIIAQWSLLHTSDPAAGTTFTFPDHESLSGSAEFAAIARVYFTGGNDGGTWTVTPGTHTTNVTYGYATGVTPGSPAWAQLALLTGVYTWGDKGGFHAGQGKLAGARYPEISSGPISGETPRPDGTLIDWNGIGAYGKPNSLTFAVEWAA